MAGPGRFAGRGTKRARGLVRRAALVSLAGAVLPVAVAPGCGGNANGNGSGAERAGSGSDRASAASTKRWLSLASGPLERTEVAAARIGRRIYVVGGFTDDGGTTDALAGYDIERDRWELLRPMPSAVNHPAAASYRGALYVHGGFADSGPSDRLYRYDPERDRWQRLPDSELPRGAHALGEIRGKLYAAGGSNNASDRLTSLEVYDIADGRWSSGSEMAVGRNHVAGAVTGGYLYVLGGRSPNLDVAERYDPRRERWRTLPAMDTPRSGFSAVAVRGKVVAFGGEELGAGGQTIEEVELYDPEERAWKDLPSMRTPRHGLGGTARARRVFALEGGPQPGLSFSGLVEYLDIPKRLTR